MKLDFQVHFGVNTAGHWEVPELGCVINDYRRFFLGGTVPILGVCHPDYLRKVYGYPNNPNSWSMSFLDYICTVLSKKKLKDDIRKI